MKEHDSVTLLRHLFGDNRAEWPAANFKALFVEPAYLKKLESMRPCLLVGGRGTGKTTSLQSLRFDSTLERLEAQGLGYYDQEYFGVLVRMNKNRVRAFQGGGLDPERWSRLFAHYFNLIVGIELCSLTAWIERQEKRQLGASHVESVAMDYGITGSETVGQLLSALKLEVSKLEVYVNNPSRELVAQISMAEAPLRKFCEVLSESGLLGDRIVFCCIDEYENLLDEQQAVINTYIKHAEPPLSYKIGVRKNGLRNRRTLDGNDVLKTPDDYAEIEIAEEGFDFFAKAVAELRLKFAHDRGVSVPEKFSDFLQDLPFSEEADLLGAKRVADGVLAELKSGPASLYDYFSRKPTSEVYFLRFWQDADSRPLAELAQNWIEHPEEWKTRFGNYGYASLFWLSKGRKGVRIRKYYCGERTYLAMAGGNIRYFLELIDAAIGYQLDSAVDASPIRLSPMAQTLAARDVGKRRLGQLESLADHGVQLKRLVLAVGKVFFELARSPSGKSPEVTSFVLSGEVPDLEKIQSLLAEGVAHLAFEADPRTKATTDHEMRDDEYRLHRIFCAFFEISHRKKRRTTFKARSLLGVLQEKPSKHIAELLEAKSQSPEDELPEQLAFFSAFYNPGQGAG